jgi:hypothetical protein
LAERKIDRWRDFLTERPILAVSDHPDDLHDALCRPRYPESLPDRVSVPELPRERIVDDYDGGHPFAIVRREVATSQHGDADGVEPARREPVGEDLPARVRSAIVRSSFANDIELLVLQRKRHYGSDSCGLDG